jgi:hypothetical protein
MSQMFIFRALDQLEEFKSFILSNLNKNISFGDMEFYYSLSYEDGYSRLVVWEVDLDEFGYPSPILKGSIGTEISSYIKVWKEEI